ncbi:MAG: hypothetical protein WA324_29210 [Bryobacteraceae bacterium]
MATSCFAYGVRIGFETTTALSTHFKLPLVPGGEINSAQSAPIVFSFEEKQSPEGPLFTIGENGIPVQASFDVNFAARALESRAQHYVATVAEHVVFVHAGVVAWQGKAILLPGKSFSGKSTLTMALVDAGATYYSDEYAVLDAQGLVHAFSRMPRLRPDVQPPRTNSVPPATALPPLPVGLVLSAHYNPDALWQPRQLTPGETLLAMLENTVAVRRQAEFSVSALKNAVASAIGLQSERADAASVARSILQSITENWHLTTQLTPNLDLGETA